MRAEDSTGPSETQPAKGHGMDWLRKGFAEWMAGNEANAADAMANALECDPDIFRKESTWSQILIYCEPSFPCPDDDWLPRFREVWDFTVRIGAGRVLPPRSEITGGRLQDEGTALWISMLNLALRRRRLGLILRWSVRAAVVSRGTVVLKISPTRCWRAFVGLRTPFSVRRAVKTLIGRQLSRFVGRVLRKAKVLRK